MTDILDLGDLDVAEVHAQLFEQQERDDGLRPEAHERRQETLKQTTRRDDGLRTETHERRQETLKQTTS